jgi:NAD(P)-dependent dehydrogenase (short-subunit alcohol dehydrogenase family)
MTTSFAPDLLAGRRILVTGGGTGLGRAMGERFLELGADLAICGRRAEVLEEAAAELGARHGTRVVTAACDLRDPAAVEAMLDAVGPLDVLVNNAAANFLARTHLLSARALDAVLGTTLHGAAYAAIGCGRRWIEQRRGGVVLSVLTLSALQGGAFTAPSAMAKAGLLAMTRSLAVEWGRHGIRLVAIAPGSFPTEAATARLRADPDGDPARGVPLGRTGTQRELADLAAFLVSDLAAYITGECVVVDGGRRLLGGSRAGAEEMLGWGEAEWARQRARTPAR